MMHDMRQLLAVAALGLGACVVRGPAVDPPGPIGPVPTDYPDGAVLRLRVTGHEDVGSFDCGFRRSWTWRYLPNAALEVAGAEPRPEGPELVYEAERHAFVAHWDTVGPVGTRTEEVRLYAGGTFTYSTWLGGPSEYSEGCATLLSGTVEVAE